jgi:hypothetical protein
MRSLAASPIIGAVLLLGTAPVFAQGLGHGPPPVANSHRPTTPSGQTTTTTTTTGGTTAGSPAVPPSPVEYAAATTNRQQTFGTWLDNAVVNAPGETWMSMATTYWRSSSLREIDLPSIGASIGIAPHAQFSASVPYYHVTDATGATFHGLGATYLTGKFAFAQDRRVHMSTSPTIEVLSWSVSSSDIHRINLVLPVSAQADIGRARLYGSTGYFSRGSVFAASALEVPAGSRATVVATLSQSYSIASDPISDAAGISRRRVDGGIGAYIMARTGVVLFGSIGRTLTPVTDTSGRLSVTGGLTMNVGGAGTNVPRLP